MRFHTQGSIQTLSLRRENGLNVVALYSDAEAGQTAAELLKRILGGGVTGSSLHYALWKFEHLCLPQLEEMALTDTAAAELLIVSTPEQTPIPEAVRMALQRWSGAGLREDRALVALLLRDPGRNPGDDSVEVWLHSIAVQAGADFFCQQIPRNLKYYARPESRSSPLQWPITSHPRLGQRTPVRSCWGINE